MKKVFLILLIALAFAGISDAQQSQYPYQFTSYNIGCSPPVCWNAAFASPGTYAIAQTVGEQLCSSGMFPEVVGSVFVANCSVSTFLSTVVQMDPPTTYVVDAVDGGIDLVTADTLGGYGYVFNYITTLPIYFSAEHADCYTGATRYDYPPDIPC